MAAVAVLVVAVVLVRATLQTFESKTHFAFTSPQDYPPPSAKKRLLFAPNSRASGRPLRRAAAFPSSGRAAGIGREIFGPRQLHAGPKLGASAGPFCRRAGHVPAGGPCGGGDPRSSSPKLTDKSPV